VHVRARLVRLAGVVGRSVTLPAGDTALVDSVPEWFNDPLRYVREAFDWGRGELAGHDGPDEWQVDTLSEIGKGTLSIAEALRIAVASGHGIGKSALVAWIILWAMSTRPHLNGVVTANTGTQLETKTWRELALWHKRAINAHWFQWTATKFYQVDHPQTWAVSAIPWSKDRSEAFAGTHAKHVLLVFDEASAIDDVIWEVAEGATTTPGAIWVAFGNPTKNTGRFRECFGKFRHRWITRQIDSRTARMANQAQLQQWIDDYGEDSDFVRVRVRGIFPRAGSSQFIGSDLIEAARARTFEQYDVREPIVMGVDPARYGDDKSVIRFRAGRDARVVPPQVYRGIDTMQLVGHISHAIDRYQPAAVFIDGGGVGGGVVDRLRQLGYPVHEVQFGGSPRDSTKFANKRAEMWDDLREWLKTGAIDNSQELADDLGGVEYGFDRNNLLQLERKEDMKKRGLASPDEGDALALTFAQRVAHPDLKLARFRPTRTAVTDYSVFGA
jgi:hypothetical protein